MPSNQNERAHTALSLCLYRHIHSWHNTHTLVPSRSPPPDSPPQLCKQLQLSHLIDSRSLSPPSPHPLTLSEPPPPPSCHCCPLALSLNLLGLSAFHVYIPFLFVCFLKVFLLRSYTMLKFIFTWRFMGNNQYSVKYDDKRTADN